ncbi:hypothetical protein WJX81_001627 [Elliptochloris bilobata]|uniref:CoA-binding domain-containing protein n=1 Tax=Elliptochloris bilobata TaxID=381761 RepID=A0AAW1SEL0_9CHLO
MSGEAWRTHIVSRPDEAVEIAGKAQLVGVLGIAPEAKADRPAHFVAKAVQASGARVIPIPVYYPDATTILGERVYRKVADVPERPLDVLDVFRRPEDLHLHLDDIIQAKPKVVWLQSGITEPAFEEELARAGIRVVADRCLKVDRAHALSRL